MTLYVVSGWLRHGTSMMMRALGEGGMPLVFSESRNRQARQRWHDDQYEGNDGYFELTSEEMAAEGFPLAYDGKTVKCLRQMVLTLPAHDYRVIYMRRDGEETRQSMQALMGQTLHPIVAQMIDRETTKIAGILRQRRDMDVIEVPYREVVADPLPWFERIAESWPIDPVKAAAVVDPAKCRFRREDLAVGA